MTFPFPISPSQINTARQCWRKYGLDYIDKVESEPNQYAALGTEMHSHLETWFAKGVLPPLTTQAGQMARVALRQWPAPTRVDECEIHISAETESAQYHGYQDIGHLHNKMHLRVVGDHKSCGDHKWNKTKEELKKDPQAIIYAAAAMIRHNVDKVICKWVYTTRGKKPLSKVVQLVMTQTDVESGFDSLDETCRDIYLIRSDPSITGMDLPVNPNACGAFGGCAHVERCNLTPKEKLRAHMSQMSLREKIEANKKAKELGQSVAQPAGKPTVASKPVKSAPKTEETAKEKLARIKAEKAAKKAEEEEADLEVSDEDEEVPDEVVEEDEDDARPAQSSDPAEQLGATRGKAKPAPKATAAAKPPVGASPGHPEFYKALHKGGGVYHIPELGHEFEVSHQPTVKVR